MHYNLLFCGCSFTEGLFPDSRFSHLVSDHFKYTHDNIAKHGISNDKIVEKTVEWFEADNTADIAIIQFTHKARITWYNTFEEEFDFAPGILKNKQYLNIPEVFDYFLINNIWNVIRQYYELIYSEYMGDQNFYKNLFVLDNYFKQKNIIPIYLTICKAPLPNKGWYKFCKDINIQHIIHGGTTGHPVLNPDNNSLIGNPQTNPENFDAELSKISRIGPSELGHQKIADYIISKIKI